MLKGWKIRDQIVAPVLVNLITALLLFVTVVLFKSPIYEYFGVTKDIPYPIRVFVEPYKDDDQLVHMDIFIVNTGSEVYTEKGLRDYIYKYFEEGARPHPELSLTTKKELYPGCKIVKVYNEEIFNNDKGLIKIDEPKNIAKEWVLHIAEIHPDTILKVVVKTNCKVSERIQVKRWLARQRSINIEGAGTSYLNQ